MASDPLHRVVDYLFDVVEKKDAASKPDGELLKRYVQDRDQTAFTALVRRHGPMVYGVCRRVLHNLHDTEDAFQATFLVLVRKAATLRSPATIGNWLYGVAYRTALHARDMAIKRRAKEAEVTLPVQSPEDSSAELRSMLDQELERLSDKYRLLLVMCDLEGRTRKEVAVLLGLPEGTIASRLARARTMLAKRLTKRGLAVSAGTLAPALSAEASSICVPISLIHSTAKAATIFGAGSAAAGAISGQVVALTQGVLKMMLLSKLKNVSVVLVTFALFSTTAAGVAYHGGAFEPGGETPAQVGKADTQAKDQKGAKNELADLQRQVEQLRDQNEKLKEQLVAAELRTEVKELDLKKYMEMNQKLSKEESTQKPYVIGPLRDISIVDATQLIEVIKKTVEPASWTSGSGTGSIIYYEPTKTVIVHSTKKIYEDVYQMLQLFESQQQDRREAEKKFVQKVYPVGDLVGKGGDSLVRIIVNTIERASWRDISGTGNASVEYFPDGQSLVIVHHPGIHTRIETLLTDLRKAKAEQEKKAP